MREYVNECLPPRCPRCGDVGVYQLCNVPDEERWRCAACDTTYTGLADDDEFPWEVVSAIKESKLGIDTIARFASLAVDEVRAVQVDPTGHVVEVQLVALALMRLPYSYPALK